MVFQLFLPRVGAGPDHLGRNGIQTPAQSQRTAMDYGCWDNPTGSYSQIENYNGKGSLVAYERLLKKQYTYRAIMSFSILCALYYLCVYLLTAPTELKR